MRICTDMTFEEVIETSMGTVTRLAYLRMGNEQDAKDILQNILLKPYTQTMEFCDPQHMRLLLRWGVYRNTMSRMG